MLRCLAGVTSTALTPHGSQAVASTLPLARSSQSSPSLLTVLFRGRGNAAQPRLYSTIVSESSLKPGKKRRKRRRNSKGNRGLPNSTSAAASVKKKRVVQEFSYAGGPGLIVYSKVKVPPDYGQGSGRNAYWLGVFPLIFTGLGSWQVYRYFWKEDLIAKLNERIRLPPVELGTPTTAEEVKELEYTVVKIEGVYEHDKEIRLGPRSQSSAASAGSVGGGDAGYMIITPLLRDDGTRILVNRGWVPMDRVEQESRPESLLQGRQTVVGVVRGGERTTMFRLENRPADNIWFWRDVDMMAEYTDALPLCVEADATKVPGGFPIGGQTRVKLKRDHVEYAVTWFALAVFTAYMTYRSSKIGFSAPKGKTWTPGGSWK